MDVKELKALVAGNDDALSAIDALVLGVETEKNNGIKSHRKKDVEVLKYKNALAKLGFNKEEHGSVDDFVENLLKTAEDAGDTEISLKSVSEELTRVKNELAEKDAKEVENQKRADNATMIADIVKSMGSDFVGPDILAENLVTQGKATIVDGKTVIRGDGDNTVEINAFLEGFAKERPELVKIDIAEGTDTTDGNDGVAITDLNEIGLEDLGL